jgi:hypothetical protein
VVVVKASRFKHLKKSPTSPAAFVIKQGGGAALAPKNVFEKSNGRLLQRGSRAHSFKNKMFLNIFPV